MAKKKSTSKAAKLALIAGLGKATPASTKKKPALTVEGFEDVVAEVVARQRTLESLQTEQEIALATLREAAIDAMRRQETRTFTKTCLLQGEGQNVRVTRKDAFSKLDSVQGNMLSDLLGPKMYKALFTEGCTLKFRTETEEFLLACKKAGLNVTEHFDRTDWIAPKKGFLETRASLRETLPPTDNDVLDALTDRVAHKASVNFKG
jgi:hypothetical protein